MCPVEQKFFQSLYVDTIVLKSVCWYNSINRLWKNFLMEQVISRYFRQENQAYIP